MKRGGHTTPWSSAREALFNELMEENLPVKEIAARMGLTENMIIGKRRRRFHFGHYAFERHVEEMAALHASRSQPPEIPRWGCCQWPDGDFGESDFRFCGEQAISNGPYCEKHAVAARNRSRD